MGGSVEGYEGGGAEGQKDVESYGRKDGWGVRV